MIDAQPVHAAAMAAIHAEAFPPGARWTAADFATLLAHPGALGLIEAEGAFALFRRAADEVDLLTVATAPVVRRRGLARALLAAAHERLRAAGAAWVFLEVADDNAAARALYASLGYAAVGTRRGYYGPVDAAIMRLAL